MADNDIVNDVAVATDGLVTLNGVPQSNPLPKAQRVKVVHGEDGDGTDTSAAHPLPVHDETAATQLTLAAVLAAVDGVEAALTAMLAKLSADPSTAAAQATQAAKLDAALLLLASPDTVYHGTAGLTIGLAAGERLHSVLVVPATGATVTITVPGQSADTPPTDFPYSEDFKGGIVGVGNLVIAGTVAYYRVTTYTP